MSWRVPPFDRAADEAVAYARATYAPLGIVIAGSIVRGEAGPTSDLDLCIVHAEPWRVREQKRFAGVPAELFVNSPAQVRRYFTEEHADGLPYNANMFATGELVDGADPILGELVREARDWLAKPLAVTDASLVQRRYGIVCTLDDARDVIDHDPAAAQLLLGAAVRDLVAYAFWKRAMFQPRRKAAVAALAAIDPLAAALVRAPCELDTVAQLARHVIAVDTFFEWSSERAATSA